MWFIFLNILPLVYNSKIRVNNWIYFQYKYIPYILIFCDLEHVMVYKWTCYTDYLLYP